MDTPAPMTIALAMATPGTGWGGMEKHTADLAKTLSDLGHRVHVLAHAAYQERFTRPIQFHHLPFQLGRRNLWLRHRLRRTLHAIQPDILHAQGNKAASLIGTAGDKARATVGTLHGTKRSHSAFDKLDGLIGVSRDIIGAARHPNALLIFNGIHPPEKASLAAPELTIPPERPLLMAAGRLEPVKQFDRLIRAWARAECGGKLVILGDGSQRSRLNALIRELGAEDRILLPGHEPEIVPWLRAATACIISSEREGFPYIMVEALMADCPVLSTPVSGVADFLPESCIAASDNIEDIAALINANLNEPSTLAGTQNASFQKAREQLSLEAMASKTEAFYRELLANATAGR